MKKLFLFLLFVPAFISAESMYSPTWGFFLDLPEGYEFIDGDGRDRFSFAGPSDAMFDLVVYDGRFPSIRELVSDINRRIGNRGDVDFYSYRNRQAAIIKLTFGSYDGWGLCVEIGDGSSANPPMLLALAYGPADASELELFHISALDSIAPSLAERHYPGPVIEYSYPRGEAKTAALGNSGVIAAVYENDAEAAQVLIEREFLILQNYANTPFLQDAWSRYYRFIYRDSYDRVTAAAAAFVRSWGGDRTGNDEAKRAFAQRALAFVQGFNYERNLNGSDFVNLVSAVTEGRGDCDSRAVLWAIILSHADIRSAFMISYHYGHAMGLADIAGTGARFESGETRWLVAETTASVDIGLINQEVSDPQYWFAVIFE
ncbi:MAG: hypothetical protein LBQ89_04410 [Treponema sp.]|nr:hypothetical protein [Treponema sp.]